MIQRGLTDLVSEFGIVVAVIVSLDDGVVEIIGNETNLASQDLFTTLFGDSEAIDVLNRSLEGEKLPHVWRQGEVLCVVCKPSNDALVGIFHHDEPRDIVETARWSKEMNRRVEELWKSE